MTTPMTGLGPIGDAMLRAKIGDRAASQPPYSPADVRSSVQLVTPAVARALRERAHFARQRNINPDNVRRLAREMSSGRFTPGTQVYICVLPDGQELIVNGNHTLEAVAECGKSQVLTITRKRVTSEDEAGRIYAVFDIQKIRTWGDSLRATGAGEGVPDSKAVLSAIGSINRDFDQSAGIPEGRLDRIEQIESYREEARLLAAALAGGDSEARRLIRRASVMGVALETFRYQPSKASEFWGSIAHDSGLTVGMPERALLGWLRRNPPVASLGRRDTALAAALAWNAAWRGESREFLKPGAVSTFTLLGTRWANGLGR